MKEIKKYYKELQNKCKDTFIKMLTYKDIPNKTKQQTYRYIEYRAIYNEQNEILCRLSEILGNGGIKQNEKKI